MLIPFPFPFISSVDGGGFELDPPINEPTTTPFFNDLVVIEVELF